MTYAATANRYRDNEVLSAGPQQLLLMVYDHLLLSMRRARVAIEQGDVPARVAQLDKARAALGELLVTLDMDKGGSIAAQLNGLYTFVLGELVDVGARRDVAKLDRLIGIVAELREAFGGIAVADAAS